MEGGAGVALAVGIHGAAEAAMATAVMSARLTSDSLSPVRLLADSTHEDERDQFVWLEASSTMDEKKKPAGIAARRRPTPARAPAPQAGSFVGTGTHQRQHKEHAGPAWGTSAGSPCVGSPAHDAEKLDGRSRRSSATAGSPQGSDLGLTSSVLSLVDRLEDLAEPLRRPRPFAPRD